MTLSYILCTYVRAFIISGGSVEQKSRDDSNDFIENIVLVLDSNIENIKHAVYVLCIMVRQRYYIHCDDYGRKSGLKNRKHFKVHF